MSEDFYIYVGQGMKAFDTSRTWLVASVDLLAGLVKTLADEKDDVLPTDQVTAVEYR